MSSRIVKLPTNIAKEVKNHIIYKNIGALGRPFFDCVNRKNCCFKVRGEKCNPKTCEHYQKEICKKLEKHPYVCNGCPNRSVCTLSKQFYEGIYAFNEYKDTLVEARSGITYSEKEIENLNKILVPLVKEQKQSIQTLQLSICCLCLLEIFYYKPLNIYIHTHTTYTPWK